MVASPPWKFAAVDTLKILWADMTVGETVPNVPAAIAACCHVTHTNSRQSLDRLLGSAAPDAVIFDFDYPDKISLGIAAKLKVDYPSVPMVVLTLQHSEALAVWTFRSHFADYLVKPAAEPDLERCLALLQKIATEKLTHSRRHLPRGSIPMPKEVPAAVQSARSLMPVLHFIENNLSDRITAEDMARLCLMSPFRFSRTFKEAFGVTFREYLLRLRMIEATRLLENPQAQVTDVAYAVGFNDMSHFSRMFKRHFGTTPSAAQEAFQGNYPASERPVELSPLQWPGIPQPD